MIVSYRFEMSPMIQDVPKGVGERSSSERASSHPPNAPAHGPGEGREEVGGQDHSSLAQDVERSGVCPTRGRRHLPRRIKDPWKPLQQECRGLYILWLRFWLGKALRQIPRGTYPYSYSCVNAD